MPPHTSNAIQQAAQIAKQGGILAYPTEAVWGLGCDPFNVYALQRLVMLKQRSPSKGLILVAASLEQLEPWLTEITPAQRATLAASWPGPRTWLVDDNGFSPALIRGSYTQVALRVTDHPLVVALCQAFGGPLVSTSANVAGQEPLLTSAAVKATFGAEIDFILEGELSGLSKPTSITCLTTGEILRS